MNEYPSYRKINELKQDLWMKWRTFAFHFKGQGLHDLLTDAEVGEDIVQDGVTCDVGSGDFAYGRDRTTKVGRQQVCGEAVR